MKSFFYLKILALFTLLALYHLVANGQNLPVKKEILSRQWEAQWIAVPDELRKAEGIYHFRKNFTLENVPEKFIIHVSGDNRYKLFVNGELACFGPARGDITHWNFETLDISKYLKPGVNTLAALVWNYGSLAPEAQISYRTGFILQGDGEKEKMVNTNKEWKCLKNKGYTFLKPDLGFGTYYVANPGERLVAAEYPWGWETSSFDDSKWLNASPILNGQPKGVSSWDAGWQLVPRKIPFMEMKEERLSAVRKAEGIKAPENFLKSPVNFVIPAHTKITLWLDQGYETDAYPVLKYKDGANAIISLRYAEALYLKEGFNPAQNNPKGNRNEVEGKLFKGYKDEILADGKEHTFIPLVFRVFRYIELSVETKENPLVIQDFYGIFSAYPFENKSSFQATGGENLDKILETGWRTLRLCSQETFVDCPYFEQVQYIGDTRIEAMVSLYNTTDDRLARNAIELFRNSTISEGITWCRWPANDPQFIPPFSLRWIEMVNDYWMMRGDSAFIQEMLPTSRSILAFFEKRQMENGLLGKVPYWNFMDWVNGWQYGIAPADEQGRSAPMDIQLLTALQVAAQLEKELGDVKLSEKYLEQAKRLAASIKATYWDESKKYFSDTPDKKSFSQHSNALAVLAGLIEGEQALDLMKRTLSDTSLYQCSLYFRYYLNQAAVKAGLESYPDLLGEWKAQLSRGMTTWAESPEPTRSDCHAWGSSPNIEVYRTILGISSAAPGFSKVHIEPHPGKYTQLSGSIPHPAGTVAVNYKIGKKGKLEAEIELPKGTSGVFVWKGEKRDLKEGKQVVKF